MRFLPVFCLVLIFSNCSKKQDGPIATYPVYYTPVKSQTYELYTLDYLLSYMDYPVSVPWVLSYDSLGFKRVISATSPADSAVVSFEHLNFLGEQSAESPDSVYINLWESVTQVRGQIERMKEQSIYYSNLNPNKMYLSFRSGAVLTFNITNKSHIGPTVNPPYPKDLRADRKAAMKFFSGHFNNIQDLDSITPGVQKKSYSLAIGSR
jgi:hypothetical protein